MRHQGFTLIEFLITLFVSAIVSVMVAQAVSAGIHQWRWLTQQGKVNEQALLVETLIREAGNITELGCGPGEVTINAQKVNIPNITQCDIVKHVDGETIWWDYRWHYWLDKDITLVIAGGRHASSTE